MLNIQLILVIILNILLIQDAHWKDAKKEQHSTRYAFRLRSAREASYRLEYHKDHFSISRTKCLISGTRDFIV